MKPLYPVTITFDPKSVPQEVHGVLLRGEFLFYKSNLTGHTDETGMVENDPKYPPAQYEDGMDSIGGFFVDEMHLNADGIYEITYQLPAGAYPYGFILNPEFCEKPITGDPRQDSFFITNGKGEHVWLKDFEKIAFGGMKSDYNLMIADPSNPPDVPTVTGMQNNSMLYVGPEEECLWLPAQDPASKGTLTYLSYKDIDGKTESIAVYLPAGYDKTKTYPLILVSHGGGGNEADWPHQGGICHIMDHLIAQGKTKPAILVCMNNSVYSVGFGQWQFDRIAKNCEEAIIPLIEKLFNVSTDVKDRAFCGLSMGSMTTLYMYMHRAACYQYYGAFSGGIAEGHKEFSLEDPRLKDVTLMIGTAEEDIAYNEREIGVPPTIRALKAKGLPYIPYFTTGSHDWFCWPQMFAYFAENVLWH